MAYRTVSTDISIELPRETYGRLASRSGLAANHGIHVTGGVIDDDFTGIVKVILYNFGKHDYVVNVGDRICQLICERVFIPQIREGFTRKDNSERNDHGFGSSGI